MCLHVSHVPWRRTVMVAGRFLARSEVDVVNVRNTKVRSIVVAPLLPVVAPAVGVASPCRWATARARPPRHPRRPWA
jgi:hypothetical protein